ncbi:MAG: PspC domain-containing protein, partial [Chloroflexota bacterium]
MNERIYRSRDDRMLAGVAGGLADLWGADPSLVRIIWALLVVFTGGLAMVVYIVMALVVPEEDDVYPRSAPTAPSAAGPGTGDAFTAAADPTAAPGTTPPPGPTGWTTPSGQDPRAARRAARAERRA